MLELKRKPPHANDTPNALSSNQPQIVTWPDVECALVLWVKDMENKGETVTGLMLREKQRRFEDQFQVPDNERLLGDSWVQSFCKTYKICEFCCHGEAASVDQDAVEAERIQCRQLVAKFAPRDRFNVDETGFNPYSPPDWGLATKQMSGKKKEKFRITIALTCNSDGSKKLKPFFIGKAAKPCCFKQHTPEQRGFYYRNNKHAWMTGALFKEWIKQLDINTNQHILLLMDNFSGHTISYQPSHIQMEYFEPNMSSHVTLALYRRFFNQCALDRDEAGESEIYKIDVLEAMSMAKAAWDKVTPDTIHNCWNHTKIQP
ncbi:DDE-domain-containing protein [Gyrodon lividus]|nr:DDE-domain-containing protein [Gyrodon lividus]